jgi:prepilin signal peptidase PulO-like enzyme (type II secretory pathway)
MIYIALVILGLCLGSFVNALVWRIYEQDKLSKKSKLSPKDKTHKKQLSILNGHSMCPHCKHKLGALDLVPVFSWLVLKGQCRYCKKPVSAQYPIVEATTALLFVASYVWWPSSVVGSQITVFALWIALLTGLVALAVYDIRWMILPNRILHPLSVIAVAMIIVELTTVHSHVKFLLDALIAALIGGGIFYILFQVSSGKWIGGGDVRLGALLGLVVATPGRSVLLIFLASLIGTIISVPFLASNKLKKNSVIPFGPLLIVAVIIVQLFGHFLIAWYQNSFFPNGV